MLEANVFNIERYATEDGYGIRTVIFLKGCQLRCRWCANPESQEFKPQVLVNVNSCISCGKCMNVCPNKAVFYKKGFGYLSDRLLCTACGDCITQCYVDARKLMGTVMNREELLDIILRDEKYYAKSGGGVTFSGGEPFFYAEMIREIGKEMKQRGYNSLVETCGQVPLERIKQASQEVDYIYFDFKHYNPVKHKELTGFDNSLILSNLEWLDKEYTGHLAVRYPYIPGCNSDDDAIRGFFQYIKQLTNIKEIVFLPYHRLGLPKYQGLGRTYEMGELRSLKKVEMVHLYDTAKEYGLDIKIQ
ncbi:choline trimethylamine-lyase activating enzyme [Lacrimispora amygdalina]|uniref:Choline trimethylamine-lyase activating enzyme n=1 Tax=Lacrimispora amygdalina TaxID=253257 RepID=A0A3E2NI91_9FIRM|nr:glycyl-radical enzyme activating protein [Clostridium indicum]RFZ80726.1 glycyl-radical enzyme activating protein [Clostridium indicum]